MTVPVVMCSPTCVNGVCVHPGVCQCDEGWIDEDCSQGKNECRDTSHSYIILYLRDMANSMCLYNERILQLSNGTCRDMSASMCKWNM